MKTCPKCNISGIPDYAKFCPVCGTKLRALNDSQGGQQISRSVHSQKSTSNSSYNYNRNSQSPNGSSNNSVDGENIFNVIILVIVFGSVAFLIIQAFL